jgi:hypothetical protein
MMEQAKPPSCSGVNTIDDRKAIPSPGRTTRSNRVVVGLGRDVADRSPVRRRGSGEPIEARQRFGAAVESEQTERHALERLAEQRRLACMRVHPSNGQRYLREVLSRATQ